MNTEKYNWTKKEVKEDDNIYTQLFYDEDKCVKYVRVTWSFPSDISKKEEEEMKSIIVSSMENMIKLVSNVVSNCCKYEITDNSMEILSFEDDDILFRSRSELGPLIKEIISEYLSDNDNLLMMDSIRNELDRVNNVLDIISKDDRIKCKLKEIYYKYLDKDL